MMSEQDLADVVQIAVEDLSPGHPGTALRAGGRRLRLSSPEVQERWQGWCFL